MNPWVRKYFSLGSVPLLLSIFPSLRRHLLRRYSASINKDKEFNEWKERFVCPDEEFQPDNFGKKLESERRLLITGQSGIGKTSFFKRLTASYASQDKQTHPLKVFPIYIPLTNYGGNSLEDLVYNQLFSYGKITDKELAPMFLEQGGLLILLDGVNEVQNVTDRQKLSAFVEKFWTSNYICLSSQHPYPEIENIPKVELKPFSREKVDEFIRQRVSDKEIAEGVIKRFTDQEYQLYSIPRDLEFAAEILISGGKALPKSRTELYKITFSAIFTKWKENGTVDAEDTLCKHAYTMIVQRDSTFDSVDDPHFKEITADLFKQKFLVRREGSYNFRHDLIRSYLASEYFHPRWNNLFEGMTGRPIDSNWLEMLKFSCENIEDADEVKSLVYEVLKRSVRKDLVKNLFEWLKVNHQSKCETWEEDFYAKYGELDFKRV
jgi:predicted NACHT family NTPase